MNPLNPKKLLITNMISSEFFTTQIDAATPSNINSVGILRYLSIAGCAFLALMLMLEPDVGFSAPMEARLLFWSMQIITGLLVLQSVLHLLTRHFGASRAPSWSLVLLSGVLGSVLLAPLYWLIGEGLMVSWLDYPTQADDSDADFMGITLANPLLQEYLNIVGPVTTAWALICLPRLHWLMPPLLHGRTSDSDAVTTSDINSKAIEVSSSVNESNAAESTAPTRSTWRDRLPEQLGTDVIAVTSELQYLRVWTPCGCALILGALADVESEDSASGLRVHRSWWVANEHVVSVRRTPTGAVCLMSDGRQVPVSRRRRSEVLAQFGDGAQYRCDDASKAVTQTHLN
jgi:hypothetical protein